MVDEQVIVGGILQLSVLHDASQVVLMCAFRVCMMR